MPRRSELVMYVMYVFLVMYAAVMLQMCLAFCFQLLYINIRVCFTYLFYFCLDHCEFAITSFVCFKDR